MKKRCTFLLGGDQVGTKDLNSVPTQGQDVTVKGKGYVVVSVTETKKDKEYDIEVRAA